MKTSFIRPLFGTFLLTGILLGSNSSANAATWTWSGSTSTAWDNSSNWTPSGTPNWTVSPGDTAVFSGDPTINPVVPNATRYVYGLTFTTATGGWDIGSGGASTKLYTNTGGIDASAQTSGITTIDPRITINVAQTWVVGTGGTLVINGALAGGSILSLGSATSTVQGTIVLNGDNSGYNTSKMRLLGGTVCAGNDSAFGAVTQAIYFINSSTLTTIGTHALANNVDLGPSNVTGTVLVGAADALTLSGTISDAGKLVKTGAGTLTLTATNTYTGSTTVSAGKLEVNGSIAAGSAVTVSSGATLSGTGTVKGTANIQGTLAAGNGVGTLMTGKLTLANTSTMDVELGRNGTTATSNLTSVTGAVDIASGADLKLTLATGLTNLVASDIVFLIANDGTDAVNGVFTSLNGVTTTLNEGSTFNWNSQTWEITYSADSTKSTFSGGNDVALMVVPEPATWAMLMGGIGMMVFVQRARRRMSR